MMTAKKLQALGFPENVAWRMANVAHDFHVDLDALTDRQLIALARECGA